MGLEEGEPVEEALRHCEGEGLLLSNGDEVSEGDKDPEELPKHDGVVENRGEGDIQGEAEGQGEEEDRVEAEAAAGVPEGVAFREADNAVVADCAAPLWL